ncbi:hypothetical protein [Spongiimicrobium salis]|uniref:hypothetical protein n=1 Tax=Spongiimicrobium salis TaxID=1667022 RepID=UPI00374D8380
MKLPKMALHSNLAYGIPLLIILTTIAIGLSPLLQQYPQIAIGITYDLVLTAPLAYFLVIRKRNIPKITLIPLIVIGIIIASYILPEQQQSHLNAIKAYVLPLTELLVLSVLVFKISKGIRTFRLASKTRSDFYEISKSSAKTLFGKTPFAAFFASEISMFYYAGFAWRFKKLQKQEFSNYKDNASIAMAVALLLVVGIETFTFHILLMKWSVVAAWIFTGSSLYTAVLIIAHIKALLLRPSLLTPKELVLKNGLLANIRIPLDSIATVTRCSAEISSSDSRIGNLGLSKKSTHHSLALYFKYPQTIEKMYGFTDECDVLLFHLDNKDSFLKLLTKAGIPYSASPQ